MMNNKQGAGGQPYGINRAAANPFARQTTSYQPKRVHLNNLQAPIN